MVDVFEAEAASVVSAVPAQGEPRMEGDFSPRKLKVAAGILIGQSFGTSILPYSALMLMLIPLTKEFGWTAQQFSWAVTFLFFFGAVSLWPIGRLADRFGVRPVLLTGTAIVGLISLGMAYQTSSLVQFYVLYALLGIFGSTGVTYTKVVAALFTQNRGKAMAVLTAETTLARAGVPLVVNWLLLTQGWHVMYLAFGVTILLCVPVLFFTIDEPGESGTTARYAPVAAWLPVVYGVLLAYCLLSFVGKTELGGQACYFVGGLGASPSCMAPWLYNLLWCVAIALAILGAVLVARSMFGAANARQAERAAASNGVPAANVPPPIKIDLPGMTIKEALKDWVFWLNTFAVFIGLFIFNGMFPHLIPALVDKGFSQTTIVELQSTATLLAFVGALIGGWAVDRFQTAKIAIPVSLVAAVGTFLTILLSPTFGGVPLLAAILFLAMLSFNALFPMGTYFATRFFGLGHMAEIVAVQFAATNTLAGFSAPLFGWIFDTTHSYSGMFMIATVANLAVAAIWLVMPKYRFAANIGQMPAQAKS